MCVCCTSGIEDHGGVMAAQGLIEVRRDVVLHVATYTSHFVITAVPWSIPVS
jgi:hypothetical protein